MRGGSSVLRSQPCDYRLQLPCRKQSVARVFVQRSSARLRPQLIEQRPREKKDPEATTPGPTDNCRGDSDGFQIRQSLKTKTPVEYVCDTLNGRNITVRGNQLSIDHAGVFFRFSKTRSFFRSSAFKSQSRPIFVPIEFQRQICRMRPSVSDSISAASFAL